ncbi:MAG: energy-coupling factor ABC transporter ATP-binding protein [Planctomycetota bacterium]|jgi:cobalt/nickel transport system ATP-binding protein
MAKAVEIENFSYNYPDGTNALADINLSIAAGEKVAIIGPNGAGKSTLLLAMSAFVKGTGSVFIDGIEAKSENTKKIRSVLGLVMQNPDEQLFMPTLFDDVAFGPMNMGLDEGEVKKRTADALKTVGLEGKGKKAPHHLSGGQKRSAAIATILSMEPKIITMDEPEASLDPRTRNNLTDLLGSLSQTLIIATCNMDFAAGLCERAVLIDAGRVIADGDARKIMSDADLMQTHGLEVPAAFS